MLELTKLSINYKKVLDELLVGSGVVLFKDVFSLDKINEARDIVNKFADNQDQKESHFNAEAESSGTIHLQQRVWNGYMCCCRVLNCLNYCIDSIIDDSGVNVHAVNYFCSSENSDIAQFIRIVNFVQTRHL